MQLENTIFNVTVLVSRSDASMHQSLAAANRRRVRPGIVDDEDRTSAMRELAAVQKVESTFLEAARKAVAAHASEAPADREGLVDWLEGLRVSGPGQLDPFFDWLASASTELDLRWTVMQELAADANQKDLFRGLNIKEPTDRSLADLAQLLTIDTIEDDVLWQAEARNNLNLALAYNGRWRDHAFGALVASLLTQNRRASCVERAFTRFGYAIYPPTQPYDPSVVRTMVAKYLERVPMHPSTVRAIAEGVLMALHASARALDGYRASLAI